MKKYLFIVCSVLIATLNLFANPDSLKHVWNNNQISDSSRLSAINELIIDYYLYTQPDSAEYYAKMQYLFSEKRGLVGEMAMSLNTLGVIFMEKDEYLEAQNYFDRSLNIKRELKDQMDIARTLNNLAILNTKLGYLSKAIEYHDQSLAFSEINNDSLGIAQSLTNIAMLYSRMGYFEKALEYINKSVYICEKLYHKNGMAINYNNLGVIYSRQSKFDTALIYFHQALDAQKELNNLQGVASILANIGSIKHNQRSYTEALDYHNQSCRIYKQLNNKEGISGTYINIGAVLVAQNQLIKGAGYLKKAFDLATEIGAKLNISVSAKELYQVYKKLGESENALKMYEIFVAVNDSLESEKNKRELIHQEYRYKYMQIHLADSLENAQAIEISHQKRQKEIEIERTRRYMLIFVFAFMLIIISIIFRVRSIKIKAEKQVLLKEIELLKSKAFAISNENIPSQGNHRLDREKINLAINGSLNDSDWSILQLLSSNPTINNREISNIVALSFEGVRSSLKKMYRLFDVQRSKENQRIALVLKAIQYSNPE